MKKQRPYKVKKSNTEGTENPVPSFFTTLT